MTEEQRVARNKYMREFRKKPEQVIKDRARKASWISRNLEKHRENKRRAARNQRWHPEVIRRKSIKYNFGILPEEYDVKLASQNNLCALCHQPFDLSVELLKPVLDHCHVTGKIREFLHRCCNLAIDHLRENPENCRLAAVYLERHSLEEEIWKT